MKSITAIGANVYDTLISVDSYPKEDTKKRAKKVMVSGGGPAATGMVCASKLGAKCRFIGCLSDDGGGSFLKSDMEKYGVDTSLIRIKSGYDSFCSSIWLSDKTNSRTCVFFKGNLPPLELDEMQKEAIKNSCILMIDGNEMDAATEAVRLARESGVKVLYDAGGLYEGVENLLPYADILIPSEEFALSHTGAQSVEEAAKILYEKYKSEVVVITCGKIGGIIYDGGEIKKYPAFSVSAVDSNGAGDVFHGAFAFSVSLGYNYFDSCVFSSAVSAIKCTKMGARGGVPTYGEALEFLKERGYDGFEKNME